MDTTGILIVLTNQVATGPCIRLSPSAAMSRCADRSLRFGSQVVFMLGYEVLVLRLSAFCSLNPKPLI